MNQPNFSPVDHQLRAVLVAALQRDPNVLHNADHLQALLGDFAPDMPIQLRDACIAVARTDATSWFANTPPYSEEQVVDWVRSQFPNLMPDATRAALATFASFGVAPPAPSGPAEPVVPVVPAPVPTPQSPVFENPTVMGPPPTSEPVAAPTSFDTETVGGFGPGPVHSEPTPPAPVFVPAPAEGFAPPPQDPVQQAPVQQPSFPPNQGSWPPPPPPPQQKRKVALILTLVAVLVLAGAGVGAFFLFKNSDPAAKTLAAPENVRAVPHEGAAIMVTWQSVPGADHYVVTDTSGGLTPKTVHGTVSIFDDAAGEDHQFVVQAYTADGDAGEKSDAARWTKTAAPGAPASLAVVRDGYNLRLTWDAVAGADGYQLRDSDDPSLAPGTVNGTSYVVRNASLTAHHFSVSAVQDGAAGPEATEAFTPKHTLSAAEATLAYRVQSSVVVPGSCEAHTGDALERRFVEAAISCRPVGARLHKPTFLYVTQLKPGTQNAYERARFASDMDTGGGCGDGPGYPEHGVRGTWTANHKTYGDTYCFVAGNFSVLVWTYYKGNVVFEANGRAPTTRTGLWNWWLRLPADLR